MTTSKNDRARLIRVLGAAIVLSALLGVVLFWPTPPTVSRQASKAATSSQATAPIRLPRSQPLPVPSTVPASSDPVITEVSVEKSRVCEGEENLVEVRAHIPGTTERPRVFVGATAGTRVPVRTWLDEAGKAPPIVVLARSASGATATRGVPYFVVERCAPAPRVTIERRALANDPYKMRFSARVLSPAAAVERQGLRATAYRWKFGQAARRDGEAEMTHDFEEQAADSEFGSALVEVEVRLEDSRWLLGRTVVELVNPAHRFDRLGLVLLVARQSPRFPELGADGRVVQWVRLRHYGREPVELSRLVVTTTYDSAVPPGERQPALDPSPEEVLEPHRVLGTTRIPPGRGIEFSVVLDTELEPDVLFRTYVAEGRDSSGRPASGTFSVMRPPPAPGPSTSIPIEDPQLMTQIQRAMTALGKSSVTHSELATLVADGTL